MTHQQQHSHRACDLSPLYVPEWQSKTELMRQARRAIRGVQGDLMVSPRVTINLAILNSSKAGIELKRRAARDLGSHLALHSEDVALCKNALTKLLVTGSPQLKIALLQIAQAQPELISGSFLAGTIRLISQSTHEIDILALRTLSRVLDVLSVPKSALTLLVGLASLYPSNKRDEARKVIACLAQRGHQEAQELAVQYPAKKKSLTPEWLR